MRTRPPLLASQAHTHCCTVPPAAAALCRPSRPAGAGWTSTEAFWIPQIPADGNLSGLKLLIPGMDRLARKANKKKPKASSGGLGLAPYKARRAPGGGGGGGGGGEALEALLGRAAAPAAPPGPVELMPMPEGVPEVVSVTCGGLVSDGRATGRGRWGRLC